MTFITDGQINALSALLGGVDNDDKDVKNKTVFALIARIWADAEQMQAVEDRCTRLVAALVSLRIKCDNLSCKADSFTDEIDSVISEMTDIQPATDTGCACDPDSLMNVQTRLCLKCGKSRQGMGEPK